MRRSVGSKPLLRGDQPFHVAKIVLRYGKGAIDPLFHDFDEFFAWEREAAFAKLRQNPPPAPVFVASVAHPVQSRLAKIAVWRDDIDQVERMKFTRGMNHLIGDDLFRADGCHPPV